MLRPFDVVLLLKLLSYNNKIDNLQAQELHNELCVHKNRLKRSLNRLEEGQLIYEDTLSLIIENIKNFFMGGLRHVFPSVSMRHKLRLYSACRPYEPDVLQNNIKIELLWCDPLDECIINALIDHYDLEFCEWLYLADCIRGGSDNLFNQAVCRIIEKIDKWKEPCNLEL